VYYARTLYRLWRWLLVTAFFILISKFILDNNDDLAIKYYTLGIDENKIILENLVDLKSEGISIQNKVKIKKITIILIWLTLLYNIKIFY